MKITITFLAIFFCFTAAFAQNFSEYGTPGSYAAAAIKTKSGRYTEWGLAVEFAVHGECDNLFSFAHHKEDVKKAVSVCYVRYNETGDDIYKEVGGMARKMLADCIVINKTIDEYIEFHETILMLSKDADAYTPNSPYIDTERYKQIEDHLQELYNSR